MGKIGRLTTAKIDRKVRAAGHSDVLPRTSGAQPRTRGVREVMPARPPQELTQLQKDKFLRLLRICGNVSRCAEAIGSYRSYTHSLRNPRSKAYDPEFSARFDDALEGYYDDLEEEGFKRAFGEEKALFNKNTGKVLLVRDPNTHKMVPLTKKVASDILLIFMLKGNRKRYVDTTRIEGGDTPLNIVSTQVKERLLSKLFPHADITHTINQEDVK